jgi:hypothetical protein
VAGFRVGLLPKARQQLEALQSDPGQAKRAKAVLKALAFMQADIRHPSLRTHKYDELSREFGYTVFTAYAEQNTPAAYRIFWRYGPEKGSITVLSIEAHPD